MKIAVKVGKAAATLALAFPVAATAQYTGQSHPDQTPITNNIETPLPPVSATPAQEPSLKPRPGIPMDAAEPAPAATPVPTFKVIGPAVAVEVPNSAPTADPDAGIVTRVPAPVPEAELDKGIVTRLPGPSNQLPAGTIFKARLGQQISTTSTASGTLFSAVTIAPVERDGRILLPAGSKVSGIVSDVHGGKRISGAASIHLRTMWITLPDGTRYDLRGQVIDTSLYKEVKVDHEGTIVRRDHAAKTASTMALATGSGAAAGAIIAGVPGALVGAGVGAGVSTVVWLKQDRQTALPAETTLTFSLTQPLTFGGE
jgi:hypothetical protein